MYVGLDISTFVSQGVCSQFVQCKITPYVQFSDSKQGPAVGSAESSKEFVVFHRLVMQNDSIMTSNQCWSQPAALQRSLLYQDDSELWHAADDLELTEELVSADDLAHFFWT